MRHSLIAVLVLCGLLVVTVVPAKAQSITQQQGDEMIKELRLIRQALEKITQPQQPQGPPPERTATLPSVGGPAMGRPDAPLTLVEFTDLQCPYCNFPLDFHPQAMPAAKAVRCAADQGKFWELRLALLRNAAKLSPAFITSAAADLKLDMKTFATCIAGTQHDARIKADMDAARSIGVEGTPSFLLGRTAGASLQGFVIVGAQPYEAFDVKIKELLAAPATRAVK